MAVDATPGGATANSYCTVAEADTYHDDHLYASAWSAASDTQKAAAVITATRLLDAWVEWSGLAASSTQALCWPRSGMLTRNGYSILSTVVPQTLKDATAEFARQLLASDLTETNEVVAKGITELKAGSIALKFKEAVEKHVVPDAVLALLVPSWISSETDAPVFEML